MLRPVYELQNTTCNIAVILCGTSKRCHRASKHVIIVTTSWFKVSHPLQRRTHYVRIPLRSCSRCIASSKIFHEHNCSWFKTCYLLHRLQPNVKASFHIWHPISHIQTQATFSLTDCSVVIHNLHSLVTSCNKKYALSG